MNKQAYFQRLGRLLDLEATAEKEQFLERQQSQSAHAEKSGLTLVNLTLRDEATALAGRVVITLGKRNEQQELPWHMLSLGTPVLLTAVDENEAWRGIVSDRDRFTIKVALDEYPETADSRPLFRLDKATDEVARRRIQRALDDAQRDRTTRFNNLRDVLLGIERPRFASQPPNLIAPHLNETQCQAVTLALRAEDIAIIHGPPGTGKTTAVAEFIRQAVQQGQIVLACAPSNLAVDNIVERLLTTGEKVVRLGHPARVLPELRETTLDIQVENHSSAQLARKMHREAHSLFAKAGRWTRAKPAPGERQAMRAEAKSLIAEARELEKTAVSRILDQADVICATTTGISYSILGERTFDVCIIDEAGQATEAEIWGPILRADKVVLAGDHQQLPPTIVSLQAKNQGFEESMMGRLVNTFEDATVRLEVQHRMHETIMNFSSQTFYDGSQIAAETVRTHLLADLPEVQATELTTTPITYIDTAGASYDEEAEDEGDSRLNPQEAELVTQQVNELLAAGVSPADIAVIAPYAAQVRLLRERITAEEIEINSVDGFQGREKEAVIISLVRSNYEGVIGFLSETRRMNVALTRARRKLIVIGDSATITVHPFYQRLVDYFESVGAYKSVWEI